MQRNIKETSNVYTLLMGMDEGKVYPKDALCRMSSESIVGEAIGEGYIVSAGKNNE